MSNMDSNSNSPVRPRFWFGFSLGLMAGVLLSILFFVVDKSLNDPIKLMVTAPPAPSAPQQLTTDTNVGKTVVVQQSRSAKKSKVLSAADSSAIEENMSANMGGNGVELSEDDAFSLPQVQLNDDVPASEFVAQSTVRVKVAAGVSAPMTTFEIEQWNEPVKNKYSYQRSGKYLKIKGMEISSVSISFEDGQYYLEYKGKKYAIPENVEWQRLTAVKNA